MSKDGGWFVEQAARVRQQRQVQAAVPSQSEPVRFARTKIVVDITNVGSTKPSVTAYRSAATAWHPRLAVLLLTHR